MIVRSDILSLTRCLSDPTRLRILRELKRECCVGELWERLGLPQNLVSHHLKVLREARLIAAEKQGARVVYRLNQALLRRRLKALADYLA